MPSRIWLACGLLAVALAARTYGLFTSSIWADDVWSIAAASGHSLDIRLDGMGAGDTYADPPGPAPASWFLKYIRPQPDNSLWRATRAAYATESHPPLFYMLLHLWMQMFGYSVAAGRTLSLILSLTAIPVLFFLARRMAGETSAWIACLFCAAAPLQTLLALQVRGYGLFGLLVLATTLLTVEILEQCLETKCPETKRVQLLIWLGVTGMVTHYYFVIYSFLQGLALLTQRKLWSTALRVGAIWTLLIALLGYYFLVQPSRLAQPWMNSPWDAGLLLLNAGSSLTDLLVLNPDVTLSLLLPSAPLLVTAIKFVLVAAVAALLMAAVRRLPKRHLIFLLVWLAGPTALMFTLDMIRHSGTVMSPRYLVGSSFALYLLLAAGLAHLRPIVRASAAAFLLTIMLAGQLALRKLPTGALAEGYDARRAALEIGRGWKPQDMVVVLSNYGSVAVSVAYYLPPETPMLPLIYLPRAEPGPVVMLANLDGLAPRLDKDLAGTPRLWVLRSYTDPSSMRALEAWLLKGYRAVSQHRYGELFLSEMVKAKS
jgi:mannosyltransferase